MMSNSSDHQQLPLDVLAGVLQHVEQGNRLHCCALVSKKWRQAANMATSSVKQSAGTKERFQSLSAWLANNQYASSIQSIEVQDKAPNNSMYAQPILQLPFHELEQLRTLELVRCELKSSSTTAAAAGQSAAVASAAQRPATLASLTALRRLQLEDVSLDLSGLRRCTTLQYLVLQDVSHVTAAGQASTFLEALFALKGQTLIPLQLATALPHLTNLQHLGLSYGHTQEYDQLLSNILASISRLQQLQVLYLDIGRFRAADLGHLPTSLTALHLSDAPNLTLSAFPRFQQLTLLQKLHVSGAEIVSPQLLSCQTQLTSLSIVDVPYKTQDAIEDVLRALQQLTQLQHLVLNNVFDEYISYSRWFSALTTSSSQLASLDVIGSFISPESVEYMFPASHVCGALTSIATSADMFYEEGIFRPMVVCCPNLQQLVITKDSCDSDEFTLDMESMSALADLTALTRLSITGTWLDDTGLKNIGTCTQLQDLTLNLITSFEYDRYVTAAGWMHLTQLTGLTHLCLSADPDRRYRGFSKLEVTADSPADVLQEFQLWLQRHQAQPKRQRIS